jgi:hypothetical protein
MTTTLALILLVCAALVVAFLLDRRSWRVRPAQSLRDMALGDDWRKWDAAVRELRRRGEALDGIPQHIAPYLLSDSVVLREAARSTLVRHFPDAKVLLSGFSVSAPPENAAEIVAKISLGAHDPAAVV